MKVLVITGDKRFGPGHPRYDLQKTAVEQLDVVFWGRGAWWPKLPQGPFDVVTVQDPFVRGLFGWYAARKLHARFNVQVHTDLSAQPLLRRLLAQVGLAQADTVRVVSRKIKNQIKTAARITVLPVFIDIGRYTTVERRPDGKTILWVGRFEDEKDPLHALEVLAEVRRKGVDAHLVMLGQGSLEEVLRERAKKMPVEFAGWQDPLPYLASASVVLSTSRHESYGASIVEALAAGVPVVAPDVGVAREAGATVVSREHMAGVVAEALRTGKKGVLQIGLLNQQEWVEEWKHSL